VLPSWRKGSALNFTTNVVWGQPGALATVSIDFKALMKLGFQALLEVNVRLAAIDHLSNDYDVL